MCFCENNFIKIKHYPTDYGFGRFVYTDASGSRKVTMDEALDLVKAFFRERENLTKEGEKE